MIYVPNYTASEYPCVVIQSATTIRAYRQMPQRNSTVNYVDYYYNSSYAYNEGSQSFGNQGSLPVCRSDVTSDWYYRTDVTDMFLLITIFAFWVFFIPLKLFSRFVYGGTS